GPCWAPLGPWSCRLSPVLAPLPENRSRLGAIEHCLCLTVVEAEPTKHEIARVAHCSLGNVAAVILRLAVAISHSAGRLDDHPQHVLNGGAFFQRHWVSPPGSGRRGRL